MMTLAELILNNSHEYNGHKQLDIQGVRFSLDEALELCQEIEEQLADAWHPCSVYVKTYSDKGASLYAEGFWKQGEHPLGHTDKVLLSFTLRGGDDE